MPDKMELRAYPDFTQQHVTVDLLQNGVAIGKVVLGPAETENFLALLARSRASLTVPVAPEFNPDSSLEAVVDPIWEIPDEREPDGVLLALQHPGFGWLSFIFPDNEAASIAECLTMSPSSIGAPPRPR